MLFKKSKKDKASKTAVYTGEPGMVYSMEPRHGHGQDVVDEDGIRQVAGCLPIDPVKKRFLLVSSSSNPGSWVIPKGGWEKDETQKQAAMRETWEEAGVKGSITRHIGVFAEKTKNGVKAHHWIYEMEIKEVTKKFPEQKKRDRRWFSYDEAMIVVKAHYIHDALSMSSLSPLVHPYCESLQSGDKKEKKKDKKKKMQEGEESEESEEKKEKKEKKKKKEKKEKKSSDEEDVSLVDDNGRPLTEEQIEEIKKQKKKEKKQKKKDAKKGEIVELNEEEITAKTNYSVTPSSKVDAKPPPSKANDSSVNEATLNKQMRQTYITTPVPNANYNGPLPLQQSPQQQQQRSPQQQQRSPQQQQRSPQQQQRSPQQQQRPPQQQGQQQRYPSPPQQHPHEPYPQQSYPQQRPQQPYPQQYPQQPYPQQTYPQQHPRPQLISTNQQFIRPGAPHPQQQLPYPQQQQQFRPMSPPRQQSYPVRPHPQQFPPGQQYQPHIAEKHQLN